MVRIIIGVLSTTVMNNAFNLLGIQVYVQYLIEGSPSSSWPGGTRLRGDIRAEEPRLSAWWSPY